MTDEQARVLGHLHQYRAANGISPTLHDLARMAGLTSRSGVRAHIQALIAAGYVESAQGSRPGYLVSRGWRLTAPGRAAIDAASCPACGQPIAAGTP